MDKARKKEWLKAYANEQKQSFKDSLTFTKKFLETQKVDVESVLDWIVNEGGGCDCEVIYNVEERFEEWVLSSNVGNY